MASNELPTMTITLQLTAFCQEITGIYLFFLVANIKILGITLISQLIKGNKEKFFSFKPYFRRKYQTSFSGAKVFRLKMLISVWYFRRKFCLNKKTSPCCLLSIDLSISFFFVCLSLKLAVSLLLHRDIHYDWHSTNGKIENLVAKLLRQDTDIYNTLLCDTLKLDTKAVWKVTEGEVITR